MDRIARAVEGNFVVCDLGSSGDELHRLLRRWRSAITLIELDAAEPGAGQDASYFKRLTLQAAISGTSGRRLFFKRAFLPCSSFLRPIDDVVRSFGLEQYFALDRSYDIECETLPSVLLRAGVQSVDFLKTDLEGLDDEVLRSAGEIVGRSLVVQSELRFQPLYESEPYFEHTVSYLRGLGFDLIAVKPEVWKYNTPMRDSFRDGRMVWGDFIFVLSPGCLRDRLGDQAPVAFCKQILLSKMLGLHGHAAHIFETCGSMIPDELRHELRNHIYHEHDAGGFLHRIASVAVASAVGNRIVRRVRSMSERVRVALTIDRSIKHLGTM